MLWYKAWLDTRWRFLIGMGLLIFQERKKSPTPVRRGAIKFYCNLSRRMTDRYRSYHLLVPNAI